MVGERGRVERFLKHLLKMFKVINIERGFISFTLLDAFLRNWMRTEMFSVYVSDWLLV